MTFGDFCGSRTGPGPRPGTISLLFGGPTFQAVNGDFWVIILMRFDEIVMGTLMNITGNENLMRNGWPTRCSLLVMGMLMVLHSFNEHLGLGQPFLKGTSQQSHRFESPTSTCTLLERADHPEKTCGNRLYNIRALHGYGSILTRG